jgi:predicted aldo/keto reductase-like oxidoreductase
MDPAPDDVMAEEDRTTRRSFLKSTVIGMGAAAWTPAMLQAMTQRGTGQEGVPRRPMGRTGEQISILAIGGAHVARAGGTEEETIAIIREGIDEGINFLDNAWEYHRGYAEEVMGKALRDGYRERVVLMTKHHGRDRSTAMQHLEDSLRRLQTDVIDVWQFHEVIRESDVRRIFSEGAIEAALEAREQGKVRYIGFTGHRDPAFFRMMLEQDVEWDTVQMPMNPLDPHYISFETEILPILLERGIAPLAMKTAAGGGAMRAGLEPTECLRYVWSRPVSTAISGISARSDLLQNIAAARDFRPMDERQIAALLERTRQAGADGEFETYKTTERWDGPIGRQQQGR